jgi:hypothetical protein
MRMGKRIDPERVHERRRWGRQAPSHADVRPYPVFA